LGQDIAHHLDFNLPVEEAPPDLALTPLGAVCIGLQEPRKDDRFLAEIKASEVQSAPVGHRVGSAPKEQGDYAVLLEVVCVALEIPKA
jgi:hypothetical protein